MDRELLNQSLLQLCSKAERLQPGVLLAVLCDCTFCATRGLNSNPAELQVSTSAESGVKFSKRAF